MVQRCTSTKDHLNEVIQAVAPVRGIVAVPVHMPDMRYLLFREIFMHPLADGPKGRCIGTECKNPQVH